MPKLLYKKPKIKILIMIDSKKRDLINNFLIAKKLEKKNYKIYFCRNGLELPFIFKYKIDIVVLTQLLSRKWLKLAHKIKKFGCMVVSLHSEGHPLLEKQKKFLARGPINDYSCLDATLTWTNEQYKIFKKFNNKNKSLKIFSVGYPRFISLQKKYKNFRENLINTTVDQNFKIILIATNFFKADFHDFKSEKKFLNEEPDQKKNRINSETRKEFIKFFNEITKMNNYFFIIKIHPMEKPDVYVENIINRSNIYISINDYIDTILPCADVLIARSCHTQFEAFALNKRIFELNLRKEDAYKSKEHIKYLTQIKNLSDFKKKINSKNNTTKNKNFKLFKKKMLGLFKFYNSKSQSEKNIIDAIDKISNDVKVNKNYNAFERLFYILKFHILTFNDYLFHDLFYQKNKKKFIANKKYFVDYRNRVDKHFHKKDLRILENAFK